VRELEKIELLEHELLNVIDRFIKENQDVRVHYSSNYASGRIHINVIKQEEE
jgi:hypothetical protein